MESPHTGKAISLPISEALKTVPEFFGVRLNEQPRYEVVERDGPVEVRRYPALATATVKVPDSMPKARDEAFKRLAAYIFGENREGAKLAMTSPVIVQGVGAMTFILPASCLDRPPPRPLDPTIALGRREERLVAAVRYRGNDRSPKRQRSLDALVDWLARRRDFQAVGSPYCAVYDGPFVLPLVKRNEMQQELRPRH